MDELYCGDEAHGINVSFRICRGNRTTELSYLQTHLDGETIRSTAQLILLEHDIAVEVVTVEKLDKLALHKTISENLALEMNP